MRTNLNQKLEKEMAEFSSRLNAGEQPDAIFKNMLRRIIKEQDRDTRHACAEQVLQSSDANDAHDICMNINIL